MRWVRSLVVAIGLAAGLALPSPAAAKLAAAVTVEPSGSGSRLVVVLSSDVEVAKSKQPSKLALTAKGKSYKLTKAKAARAAVALGTWRSSVLKGKAQTAAQALVGKKVSVVVTPKSGPKKTIKAVAGLPVSGGGTTPGSTTTPGATTTPGSTTTPGATAPTAPAPLFGTPATALEGQAAANAILPFLLNSRFTDCVAGWPSCPSVYHFGHFPNGDMYYCRLTNVSGADIINRQPATNLTVTGANQAIDGSWAVSYAILNQSNNVVNYRWDVTAQGAATGQYWSTQTVAAGQQPNEIYTGYVWVRGARDCTY